MILPVVLLWLVNLNEILQLNKIPLSLATAQIKL